MEFKSKWVWPYITCNTIYHPRFWKSILWAFRIYILVNGTQKFASLDFREVCSGACSNSMTFYFISGARPASPIKVWDKVYVLILNYNLYHTMSFISLNHYLLTFIGIYNFTANHQGIRFSLCTSTIFSKLVSKIYVCTESWDSSN